MKTLGLIGAGMIGGTLARLAVAAGLEVVVANSRAPQTLAGLIAELGEHARAAPPAEAAAAGDLVVASIPLRAYSRLPAAALAAKTVIDTMNYIPQRDGPVPELDDSDVPSSALVQRHLPHARVVKACNNIGYASLLTLARPAGSPDRSALPIAGDNAAAKAQVTELLDVLGYDTVDIGTLADSWRCQPGTPVYTRPYQPGRPPQGVSLAEYQRWAMATPSVPVPAAQVRELIACATRGPAGGASPLSEPNDRRHTA